MPAHEIRRLLVVKTSSMGDLVHTLSALIEACEHCPHLEIDWVCEESFADIARLIPQVKQVITLAQRRWRRSWWRPKTWIEVSRWLGRLRSRRYDLVVDAQGLLKSAWVTRAAQAGARVGFDRASAREPLASLVLSRTVHAPAGLHAIERLRMLFGAALGYEPHGPVRSLSAWNADRADRSVIFLHGTSRQEKSWPKQSWIALGKIASEAGLRVELPWGSPQEFDTAQEIAQAIGPGASCMSGLSLAELADRFKHCGAAVGVDSGLMHLAAATGCPTVAIMSAAHLPRFAAQRFAPFWAPNARVLASGKQAEPISVQAVSEALHAVCRQGPLAQIQKAKA